MEFRYNYDDMIKCSEQLNRILLRRISEQTLDEFYNTAMNIEWQSSSAEKFREEVKYVISVIKRRKNLTEQLKKDLKALANFPRKAACKIREMDNQIAIELNELKF